MKFTLILRPLMRQAICSFYSGAREAPEEREERGEIERARFLGTSPDTVNIHSTLNSAKCILQDLSY